MMWSNNKKAWMNSKLWVHWLKTEFYPQVKEYIKKENIKNAKVRASS